MDSEVRDLHKPFYQPTSRYAQTVEHDKNIPTLACGLADIADFDAIEYPILVPKSKGTFAMVEDPESLKKLQEEKVTKHECQQIQEDPASDNVTRHSEEAPALYPIGDALPATLDAMGQDMEKKISQLFDLYRLSCNRTNFDATNDGVLTQIHGQLVESFREYQQAVKDLVQSGYSQAQNDNGYVHVPRTGVKTSELKAGDGLQQVKPPTSNRALPYTESTNYEDNVTAKHVVIIDLNKCLDDGNNADHPNDVDPLTHF